MSNANLRPIWEPCPICQARAQRGWAGLCAACERYASQDYVAQRELPLPESELAELGGEATHASVMAASPDDLSGFERILEQGELSSRQKEVLWQRFVEGASYAQIADSLGISKPSALRLLRRALRTLRRRVTKLHLVGAERAAGLVTGEREGGGAHAVVDPIGEKAVGLARSKSVPLKVVPNPFNSGGEFQ